MKAADLLASIGVLHSCIYKGQRTSKEKWQYFAWAVTLHFENRVMNLSYKLGAAHVRNLINLGIVKPLPPTLSQVASSICADAQAIDSFPLWEDFANYLSYNVDSVSDRRRFKKTVKNYRKLRDLLGIHFAPFLQCEGE